MPTISSSDGVEIYYEALGEGDTCLVFIGGLGVPTALKIWRNQLQLSSKYKMILLDLPGHGQSGKNRDNYTIEQFAQDVKSVVEALELSDILLIGHSMGGCVILESDILMPERIRGLIAIDSLFLTADQGYVGHEDHMVKAFLRPIEKDFIGTMTFMVQSMLSDKMDPQDIEEFEKTPYLLDRRSIISALKGLLRWDVHKALPQISSPLKCIVAGKTLPPGHREEYNRVFDTIYHEDMGHLLFMEEPTDFNGLLDDRINEILK